MQSTNAPAWIPRYLIGIASALFLLQVALLAFAPSSQASSLLSNLIQLASAVVAMIAAARAARNSEGFSRQFWRLFAAAFLIWVVAQSIATFYDSILHRPTNEPWPSDILFFSWVAPAFLALLIDPARDPAKKDWQQILDFLQVAILLTAAYLFAFENPDHWRNQKIPVGQLILTLEAVRDAVLTALFAFRALTTRQARERSLYGRMAIFFLGYGLGNFSYLYLQFYRGLHTGTFWDLSFSFPFVLGTILIVSAPLQIPAPEAGTAPGKQKVSGKGTRLLLKVVPLVFPLVVLLMAAHIAEEQLGLAVAAVLLSFGCSGASVLLSEQRQRKYAAELEEKNALLRSIFEGTDNIIYLKDLEGRYVIANEALAKSMARSVDAILGKTVTQILDFPTARRISETDRAVVESGQTETFEYEISVNGKTGNFLVTKSPYRDSSSRIVGVIGVGRDITEFRLMQDRLRQSQKMEAIGTLAGGVAHDFNNILMVISGYSQVLIEALDKEPKLRSHVEQMQKAGERAAALTRQLLAFSRKQTTQPESLNLNRIVAGMEKMLHRLIGEHIAITTSLAPDLGIVKADVGQLEQVILNLAVNARDAMPQGGQLALETKNIDIGPNEPDASSNLQSTPCVQLEVRDTGIGMEPAVQSHIFEPFFTTKPPGKGTGLGLSTVYGIVEQAGGHITFASAPGAGTSFRILLPRIGSQKPARTPGEGASDIYQGRETVLLVEDDAAVCELVRAVLTSHGYQVLTARHPEEAQAICAERSNNIQLLLTDVIMPGMSGAELFHRITIQIPAVKVLFMSGYIDDSLIRQGIHENEVAFLQKPFSPLSLAKKVREVLDGIRVS